MLKKQPKWSIFVFSENFFKCIGAVNDGGGNSYQRFFCLKSAKTNEWISGIQNLNKISKVSYRNPHQKFKP